MITPAHLKWMTCTVFNNLDEQKLLDKLPRYAADSPDAMPSSSLYEGDLHCIMSMMNKLIEKWLSRQASVFVLVNWNFCRLTWLLILRNLAQCVYDRCTILNVTIKNQRLPWVDVIRYLGIYIIRSCKLKCSLDDAKHSFYHSLNSTFEKVGKIAPEGVVLHLVHSKCLPILLAYIPSKFVR